MKPNSLIKIDDLYWSEMDNKYHALSQEEIEAIIVAAIPGDEQCISDDGDTISIEDISKAVDWATNIRAGNLILDGVFSGRIKINIVPEADEPMFYEVKNDTTNNA